MKSSFLHRALFKESQSVLHLSFRLFKKGFRIDRRKRKIERYLDENRTDIMPAAQFGHLGKVLPVVFRRNPNLRKTALSPFSGYHTPEKPAAASAFHKPV